MNDSWLLPVPGGCPASPRARILDVPLACIARSRPEHRPGDDDARRPNGTAWHRSGFACLPGACRIRPTRGPTWVPRTLPDPRPKLNRHQEFDSSPASTETLSNPCSRPPHPARTCWRSLSQQSARSARSDPNDRAESAPNARFAALRQPDSQTWNVTMPIRGSGEIADSCPEPSDPCSATTHARSQTPAARHHDAPRHR